MGENRKNLVKSVVKILNPLVRILLNNNVSFSEFVEISKRAYVGVAYKHFSIPNRKKTYARVAVITGLNLKEVNRISKIEADELPKTKGPLNRANQVISGWLRDKDFLDENGQPKELVLRRSDSSFEELVRRYSGDISARAILDELIRVGAVTKIDKESIKLAQKGFIPQNSESAKIDILAKHTCDLMNSGIHNMTHEQKDAHFQRQVTYAEVPESVMEEFRHYSHEKSIELLMDFDRFLSDKIKQSIKKEEEPTGRVGVGLYYFRSLEEE